MNHNLNRRDFLTASALAAASLRLTPALAAEKPPTPASTFKTTLRTALIRNQPTEAELAKLKEAGFDGVEAGIIPPADAEQCRAVAEKLGMRIHAVLRGWAEFNSPDPAKVESSFKVSEDALRAAQAFGADAVLLVPCRIGGMKMPRPWEFLIEFDEKTGHVSRVTHGDNSPYDDYIKAHNHAIDTSRKQIERLIPVAEQCGVVIALENVWNNLWVKPGIFRHFVASFQSKWVKAYFDIGNHVKYAPPEEWILTLGDLIAKCHVKDFKLDPADPSGGGKFVNIRDGSVRWPVVRAALEAVGYSGWMTIEGGSLSVEEHGERLELIVAGK
jgi:hexulose-6-phosphate isomerase